MRAIPVEARRLTGSFREVLGALDRRLRAGAVAGMTLVLGAAGVFERDCELEFDPPLTRLVLEVD